MARKLTDAEFVERTRAANRRRTERYQQRLAAAGKSALTVWLPESIRTALTTKAANDGATIADTAAALLSAALEFSPAEFNSREERDTRIVELKRQGVSGREIARQTGVNESTVRSVLKRLA